MAVDEGEGDDGGAASDAGPAAPEADDNGTQSATVGTYDWDDFRREFHDSDADAPFSPESYLGFDPRDADGRLGVAHIAAETVAEAANRRTVRVDPDVDEAEFFTTDGGAATVTTRYDLEKAVPDEKKQHFREVDRYWVNEPYAFVIIFHSEKENEKKYYLVEPHLSPIEDDLREFLAGKLKTAIKYSSDETVVHGGEDVRASVIESETHALLDRYDLYADGARPDENGDGLVATLSSLVDTDDGEAGLFDGLDIRAQFGFGDADDEDASDRGEANGGDNASPDTDDAERGSSLRAVSARPEPAVVEEDAETLTSHQIEKLLYMLKRDFIGYERIDGIKHDINVEDISCDGYNSPVFVYHSDYEQVITNVYHGEDELDEFVVKLAQRSGKGISKRSPQVDATLPDGSRSQLTLGREVSDHGTNYTIRQFKDVPFTPIDLINWNTFSLDEMAFLWLCIENNKSLVFAGGTASGKTTSLNAVSLFIPSKAKIVSIEDTREVELPQRNWIASVTRPSFSDGDKGDVDEFDLLEAALRQRPDYIVMGEIRGEEGRTLFQVMSTGHTTLTTFHADSVGEVIKRFTTDPINVSKTMFTALDLVSIQTQTRVGGNKVRRNKSLTEINHYDPENDEINVRDVYQWQAETDQFLEMGTSNTLEQIRFDRGWTQQRLDSELRKRKVALAYLIHEGLNTYTQVAATLQAFVNDPDTIISLIASGDLERSLEDLREMESVQIDIDPEKEAMVPRPDPGEALREETAAALEAAEPLLEQYRDQPAGEVADALDIEPETDIDIGQSSETPSRVDDEDTPSDDASASADGGEQRITDAETSVPDLDDIRRTGTDDPDR
ncbi:type IV pilus biogenesis complex ATPase subunit [Natronomonas pharaonis DSM 2160]|uniref:Type IV pilus biogenesis complex ATPase subunit n=1 Tax=Natronomonas pharaonis (strain ATCC 35678 / DSM 2160 / CIP 103997 / JCM 8858 / NBRC 14720 / NCIMB 2260 / Gabara) TaxID=348780 RepID=A0A1U7EY10_NATPD|nr:type II/IV secretion system ATPase subunit [Natronomonas pharaonis]CAI50102.1 type IV pilus biogenesis complex ATPase subunit [Natronomonas pharaonis DSM 2160]